MPFIKQKQLSVTDNLPGIIYCTDEGNVYFATLPFSMIN